MRGVARRSEYGRLDRAEALRLRHLDLPERAVLIVRPLHDQDRHADVAERLGDVPFPEIRIEPRADPGAERAVDIGVPALELVTQNTGVERLPCAADFGESHLLGEEMRRHEHEAADAVILHAAGI